MVPSNAQMVLMNQWDLMEYQHAASRNIHSTTIKNVVVKLTNGNVLMVTVSTRLLGAMVLLNAKMHLMKMNLAASMDTSSTIPSNVDVIQRLNGPVTMVNASQ
jgi:hypothetical protein